MQQQTSFARIIITPILVMIVASFLAVMNDNLFLPALIGGLVVSVVYILWASQRKRTIAPYRPAPTDHAATLAQLATLRDRGAISDAEYDAKERDLLARM